MSDCVIKFAKSEDIPLIMDYININWRKNHILSRDRELFEWQYVNDNRVCFVVGFNYDGLLKGILGYIPYDVGNNKDIALALWSACPEEPLLGIKMMMFLMENETFRDIICTGINMETTERIYNRLGMSVFKMTQWYRLSPRNEYHIGSIKNKNIPHIEDTAGDVVEIESLDRVDNVFFKAIENNMPQKSKVYLEKRYFSHPIYSYRKFALLDEKEVVKCIFVIREQKYEDSCVLRFVDLIGSVDGFNNITTFIDNLMIECDAEYIDLYESGISNTLLQKSGWSVVQGSNNIIPNYFSPFVQCVVDIFCCSSNPEAVLFRGDGDQDRPS